MPLPPPPDAPSKKLDRIEIWSDVECNSGTRLAFVPTYHLITATEYTELGGEDYVELEFDINAPSISEIQHKRVIRLLFNDDGWTEYRIRLDRKERQNLKITRTVKALAIKFDLAHNSKLLGFEQANGLILHHHELLKITAEQMLDAVLATSAAPTYFAKGTVDTTDDFTIVWDWETPLTAIEEVAVVTGLEFQVRRNGTTNYLIDLITEINSTAEKPEIRFARNVLSDSYETDSSQMGTIIYMKGEGPQGASPTVADMRFLAIDNYGNPSTEWDLAPWDGGAAAQGLLCINENDQFNDFYLEDEDGNLIQITDSAVLYSGAWMKVTLASSVDIDDQKVWIREAQNIEATGGVDLTYIPLPSAQATYDDQPLVLERLDVPGVTNLCRDPLLETYPDATLHSNVGTPTSVTKISLGGGDDEKIHYGDSILKVVANTGSGVQVWFNRKDVDANYVLAPGRPYLTFQSWLYVEQGQAEFYINLTDANNVGFLTNSNADSELYQATLERWPPVDATDSDGNDVSSAKTAEIESGAPGDFFHLRLTPALVNWPDWRPTGVGDDNWQGQCFGFTFLATRDNTTFYIDAIQLVNQSYPAEKFVHGSSYALLWDAAIRAFNDGVSSPKATVNLNTLDLHRLANTTYPYDELLPGVTVVLNDPDIATGIERRVASVQRDLKREAITNIELIEEDVGPTKK
jgi:hypothetical protein